MIHVLISTTFDDEVHFDMGLLFIVKLEAYCRKPVMQLNLEMPTMQANMIE